MNVIYVSLLHSRLQVNRQLANEVNERQQTTTDNLLHGNCIAS